MTAPAYRDAPAGGAGTVLPRWVEADTLGGGGSAGGIAASGPAELRLPLPAAAAEFGRSAGVPAGSLVLAALARVVGTLAGETLVVLGYRRGDGPVVPLRLELSGSWADLVRAAGRAEQAATSAAVSAAAGASATRAAPAEAAARFDVVVGAVDGVALGVSTAGGEVRLRHHPRHVDAGYAARIAGYLSRALAAMAADPAAPHGRADLLSAAERRHLVHERASRLRVLPDIRVAEVVAAQARRRPHAVALCCRGEVCSYDQLDGAANQVAHALLAEGLRAEEVVAVATERSPRWAAAILGVFKAGGAYLPVDPDYPAARVAALLARSRCRFVLTDPGGLPALTDPSADPAVAAQLAGARPMAVEAVLRAGHRDTAPDVEIGPKRLAYVYFTSGSTGEPKGAMCEHRGMENHLAAKIDDLRIGEGDVVVQNAQASFDISLWQLVAPLMVGGRALIVPRDELEVSRFLDTVVGGDASVLQVVPSYLDILMRHVEEHPRDLGRLRCVSVTGEAIGMPLVRRWFAAYPGIALVNAYGATEASDDTTHEVMTAPPPGDLVPVGRPVGNVTVYVLGPHESLQPLGGVGEIAFSGVCVGRGYLNDPARTAEAFGEDPFRPRERMYRTGDVGRWLPSGSIEFRGRRDEQVKVNGIRLELGEVESRLLAHPRVRAASAVVAPLPGGGTSLVAFYTSADGLEPDELREELARVLPPSAVPARLYRVEALPLTENGKVDKRQLAGTAWAWASGPPAAARVRPSTPTQRRIAEVWGQALNRPVAEIGLDDDFFDIGGGSLSALRVVARLGGLITLHDLLGTPVLGSLAAVADREPDPDAEPDAGAEAEADAGADAGADAEAVAR